jgi:hypothetical protein
VELTTSPKTANKSLMLPMGGEGGCVEDCAAWEGDEEGDGEEGDGGEDEGEEGEGVEAEGEEDEVVEDRVVPGGG